MDSWEFTAKKLGKWSTNVWQLLDVPIKHTINESRQKYITPLNSHLVIILPVNIPASMMLKIPPFPVGKIITSHFATPRSHGQQAAPTMLVSYGVCVCDAGRKRVGIKLSHDLPADSEIKNAPVAVWPWSHFTDKRNLRHCQITVCSVLQVFQQWYNYNWWCMVTYADDHHTSTITATISTMLTTSIASSSSTHHTSRPKARGPKECPVTQIAHSFL